MKQAILYSDTKSAQLLSQKIAGISLFRRTIQSWKACGVSNFTIVAPVGQLPTLNNRLALVKDISYRLIELSGNEFSQQIKAIKNSSNNEQQQIIVSDLRLLPHPQLLSRLKNNDSETCFRFANNGSLPPLYFLPHNSLPVAANNLEELIESIADKQLTTIATTIKDPIFIFNGKEDIAPAEKYIGEIIRKQATGVVARAINKKISLPISMQMARRGIGPNVITLINLIIGASSGYFVAQGNYLGMLIGATLFQAASIIDGCDGEVAKLLYRATKFGQIFDTISDNLALLSFISGLFIGTARLFNSNIPYYLGATLLLGISVFIGGIVFYLKKYTTSASLNTLDREYIQPLIEHGSGILVKFIKHCKFSIKKDVISLIYFVAAVFGILPIFLPISVIGSWIGVVVLLYLLSSKSLNPEAVKQLSKQLNSSQLNGKRVCVFDFDGTIVDSMDNFAKLAGKIMHELYNISPDEGEKKYIQTSGLPFVQQIEMIFPNDRRNKKTVERFEREKLISYYSESIFSDVPHALKYLKKRGIKTAISSNNHQEVVDDFVARANLKFDLTLGYKENFAKGEDHFNYIRNNLGVKNEEILFVGDSLKDAERATQSSIDFIGRNGLFGKKDFEQLYPGTPVINSLDSLRDFI